MIDENKILNRNYYPMTLADANKMVDLLRERVIEMLKPVADVPYGLTPKENMLYQYLKGREGFTPYDRLRIAVCGFSEATDNHVKVLVHSIRRKLPPTERILNHWGHGYKWASVPEVREAA